MKHLIDNYDQVKIRLTELSKEYNGRTRDYYFAIGDLFNQNIPKGGGASCPKGISAPRYAQMISAEIDRLLIETETDLTRSYLQNIRSTARAWPKGERVYDVSFSVYGKLTAHKDLMRGGMRVKEAQLAVEEANGSVPSDGVASVWMSNRLHADRVNLKAYNRAQTLKLSLNTLRSVVDNDNGTDLTEEDISLIGEAYAVLDSYCERKGVHMWDSEAVAA